MGYSAVGGYVGGVLGNLGKAADGLKSGQGTVMGDVSGEMVDALLYEDSTNNGENGESCN